MLAINPNGGCVVGIKVMEDHALGALTDLEASLLGNSLIHLLTLPQREFPGL